MSLAIRLAPIVDNLNGGELGGLLWLMHLHKLRGRTLLEKMSGSFQGVILVPMPGAISNFNAN
ncbi:hypothetical protein [Brachybacterium sp. FME24]|uniref:hypothetical protein n=1 Tax=Brachybacterium sp. FME24 TaxID=2742605 RepID=UPI0018673E0D|nr:hypothetical protein [Brachybacterium sp. FME24]